MQVLSKQVHSTCEEGSYTERAKHDCQHEKEQQDKYCLS